MIKYNFKKKHVTDKWDFKITDWIIILQDLVIIIYFKLLSKLSRTLQSKGGLIDIKELQYILFRIPQQYNYYQQ